MPRSGKVTKRQIGTDSRYNSPIIAKIINRAMKDGKKTAIEKQVYGAMDIIAKQTNQDPLTILNAAMENIKPQVEVRPRRIGGAAYQVPMQVRGDRKDTLAVRWLVTFSRKRPNSQFHSFALKLSAEILDAYKGEGAAVKKREEVHRIADANKAFAHFRW